MANKLDNQSLFKGLAYRWSNESKPFAYAIACVEAVSQNSIKAKSIYNNMIEAWGKSGVKTTFEETFLLIPGEKQEEIKNALLHPGKLLLPDPNQSFTGIKKEFSKLKIDEEKGLNWLLHQNKDVIGLGLLVAEFIKVGFNREENIEKNQLKVVMSNDHPWLFLAVELRTVLEYIKVTLERLNQFYNLGMYNGKPITDRMHRKIVDDCQKLILKLKNDRIF
jgi:hypothetical protein